MTDAAKSLRTRTERRPGFEDGINRGHIEKPANTPLISLLSPVGYESESVQQPIGAESNGEAVNAPFSPRDPEPPSPPFDDRWKSATSSDFEAEGTQSRSLNDLTDSVRDPVIAGPEDMKIQDHSESESVPQKLDKNHQNRIRRVASVRTRKHELIRFAALCPHLYYSLTTYS